MLSVELSKFGVPAGHSVVALRQASGEERAEEEERELPPSPTAGWQGGFLSQLQRERRAPPRPAYASSVSMGGDATGGTPAALSSSSPTVAATAVPASAEPLASAEIPGLTAWLLSLGLEPHSAAVAAWADSMGAVTLDEVADNLEAMANALPLKPLEARRLKRDGVAMAMDLSADATAPCQQLIGAARDVCVSRRDAWDIPPLISAGKSCATHASVSIDQGEEDHRHRCVDSAERWLRRPSSTFLADTEIIDADPFFQASSCSSDPRLDDPTRAITSRGRPRTPPSVPTEIVGEEQRCTDDDSSELGLGKTPPACTSESGAMEAHFTGVDAEQLVRAASSFSDPRCDEPTRAITSRGTRRAVRPVAGAAKRQSLLATEPDPSVAPNHASTQRKQVASEIGERQSNASRGTRLVDEQAAELNTTTGLPDTNVSPGTTASDGDAMQAERWAGDVAAPFSRPSRWLGPEEKAEVEPVSASSVRAGESLGGPAEKTDAEHRAASSTIGCAGGKLRGRTRKEDGVAPRAGCSADPWALGSDPWTSDPARAMSRPLEDANAAAERNYNATDCAMPALVEACSSSNHRERPLASLTLRVDAAAGAGLCLLWSQREGYFVNEIDKWPGQPGLLVGDTIRAIDGIRLDDAVTEQEVERRFASAFRDGAIIQVLRSSGRRGGAVQGVPSADAAEFEATLRVRAGRGEAGLSLVWHPPEGYFVEKIDRTPGQPSLRPGDVLRSVDEVALAGFIKDSDADNALAGALRNGACLRVFRPRANCIAGDIVRVPTAAERSGGTPLWVSSLGVGTWSWGNDKWGHNSWGLPAGSAEDALAGAFHGALDRGAFLFDSAPTYGRGFAENTLGRLCSGGRYAAIATKYYPREGDRDLAGSMLASARATIARLRLSGPLDLLQLHRPADPPTSLETQADALAAVVQAGLVRAVGVCNFSKEEVCAVHERLRKAHGVPLGTCQVEFSLARQLPAACGLLAACREMGVVVLAYSPLAMGRLSGKYDPMRCEFPRWGRHGDQSRPFGAALDGEPAALVALLRALRETGRKYGRRSPAQVALNWCLAHGAVALAGARTRAQAEENAGAMGWRLSGEDLAKLSTLSARGSTSEYQHG